MNEELFGLLGIDPERLRQQQLQQGLLSAGLGMLAASGPSSTPTGLGQVVAQGGMAGMQAYQGARQSAIDEALQSMKIGEFKQKSKQKQQAEQAINDLIASNPAIASNPSMAAYLRAYPEQALKELTESKVLSPGQQIFRGGEAVAGLPEKDPEMIREFDLAKSRGMIPKDMDLEGFAKIRRGPLVQNVIGDKLTPGQEALDKDYAKQFNEWTSGGGFSDARKQIQQLDSAVNMLATQSGLTGPAIGLIPEKSLPIVNPKAASVKESVEEVVQRNLRLILGAQFTEREGERLISRAYNIALPQEENARRLKLLTEQIADAARAKQEAADYFSKNGTLRGWNGSLFGSFNQFLSEYESRVNKKQESKEKERRPLGSIFK